MTKGIVNTVFEYYDELLEVLDKYNIHVSDVCLIGGTALNVRNIRRNRDIDIVIKPSRYTTLLREYGNKINKTDQGDLKFSENIHSKAGVFEVFNIPDENLINNQTYHDILGGVKIATLDLVYAKKMYRLVNHKPFRLKDLYDVYLIRKYDKKCTQLHALLNKTSLSKYRIRFVIFLSYIYHLFKPAVDFFVNILKRIKRKFTKN